MEKKVAVICSRDFADYELFCRTVDLYLSDYSSECKFTFLSARGLSAALLTERYARERRSEHEAILPNETESGKLSFYMKNKKLVEVADLLIAFVSEGKEEKELISIARKRGILVYPYWI